MYFVSKFLLTIMLFSIFSVYQAKLAKIICKDFPKTELEQKRDVKFLLVLMRHGARAVTKQSIWNNYFKTFKADEFGKLSNVGKNQAVLAGLNLKLNYPTF